MSRRQCPILCREKTDRVDDTRAMDRVADNLVAHGGVLHSRVPRRTDAHHRAYCMFGLYKAPRIGSVQLRLRRRRQASGPTDDLSGLLICMSPTDDTRLAANTWQPTACRAGLLEACTTKDETLTTSMRAAALTRRPRLDQGSPSAPCFTVTATVSGVATGTMSFSLRAG